MSLPYANSCTTLLDSPHSHSRSVAHASGAIIDSVLESTRRVLEGGSLLHRIPWQPGTRLCQNIAKSYANFTIRHYGSATTVVFEGCEEESPIKDDAHQRRGHNIHAVVSFTAETCFSGKEEASYQETPTN